MAISYLSGERIQGIKVDRTGTPAGTAGTWTATESLNTGRKFGGGGGLKTSAIVYGGYISGGRTASTETFNGTTWTESTSTSSQPPSMDTALEAFNGGGNASNAISVSGYTGSANVTTTETYAGGTAWAAAAAHPVAVRAHGCDGNSVNALSCGGYTTSNSNGTYTYLGSGDAWTTQADTMNYSGHAEYGGTALRGIRVGGYSGSYLATAETWSYDGSGTDGTWTSIANILEEGRERASIAGNDTNAVWAGGWEDDFTYYTKCNTWNGSAWATGTAYPIATGSTHSGTGGEQASAGTKDGAMFCGGNATITNCYYWSDPASAVSPTIPTDVPAGTRYEETDTRKIYRLAAGLANKAGIKAYYNFEQATSGDLINQATGSDYPDGTGSTNDSTATGSAVTRVSGKVGSYAYEFDGTTDGIVSVGSDIITGTGAYTIAMWLWKDADASETILYMGTTQEMINYNAAQNKLYGHNTATVYATTDLVLGEWHHCAITRGEGGATVAKIYFDGTLEATGTNSVNVSSANHLVTIGGYSGVSGEAWDGKIDELVIADRAFTAAEISTLYSVGVNDKWVEKGTAI